MPVTLQNPLQQTLAGLTFASPLMNASGAFYAPSFERMFPLKACMGGLVTKTTTKFPQAGNPQPRTVELPGIGMLNSIGLQNPGLDYTLSVEVPALLALNIPVLLSISAHSTGDFAAMAEAILAHTSARGVHALEMNLSCPNVEKGGVHFGSSPESVRNAIAAVATVWHKPIFAKLTPNVGDIVSIGAAAIEGGAQGLTAINTVLGVAIDVLRKKPIMPRISAGYSGPGIKPIALHAIWNLHRHFPETTIIGVGGAGTTTDVLEFIMAGASLVQLGTACFREPGLFSQIHQELLNYCSSEGVVDIKTLVGCAHA